MDACIYLAGVICCGGCAKDLGVELMKILWDLSKQVVDTLAHARRVLGDSSSGMPMAVAASSSSNSEHEGCILMAATLHC